MTSIATQIGKVHASIEAKDRATEFVQVAKILMTTPKGLAVIEAEKLRANPRVAEFIKTVVAPGTTSDATFASPLAQRVLADAFLSSLAPLSLFDALWPSFLQVPLNSSVVSVSATIAGAAEIPQTHVKPTSKLTLAASDLDAKKIATIVAVTDELLKIGGTMATNLLRRELTNGVAKSTNTWLLSTIAGSATSVAASGFTSLGVRQDLRTLLSLVNSGADAKLFLITTRTIAEALTMLPDSAGSGGFPQATVQGGSIGGIPLLVCDEVTSGEMILLDAGAVAAGTSGALVLEQSNEATIQLDTAPDSPQSATTNVISLWQNNLSAIRAERYLGAKLIRSDAIAKLSGVSYTGNSPV
jgi:Phage capsid family